MCGIVGLHCFRERVDPHWTKIMTDLIRHRGPDDEGYLFVNTETGLCEERRGNDTICELKSKMKHINEPGPLYNLSFGHRRLSIIDLSHLGHMPMAYENGNFWIIFNGEIFNYIELKDELKQSGYHFNTQSDTEVILASYLHWGFDCVTHFNGDWAFCIYDRTQNLLFASRDRYGVKFLYYYWDGKVFAFASEIKALLSLPFVKKELDIKHLIEFLLFGLIDHSERTSFENIRQLKPGHSLILDLNRKELKISNYYRLNFNADLGRFDEKKSYELAGDIKDLFYDAVRIRLRSDVPVGSCLSGGIDSSSIVLVVNDLMKREGAITSHIGERQKTFTASYINEPVDETPYAVEVIQKTEVDGQFTFPDGEKLWQELEYLLHFQDEPFGSTSIYAQWNVMRLASQHVKVVLDGQGGDELFGGYFFYPSFVMSQGHWGLFWHRLKLYKIRAFQELLYAFGFRGFKLIPKVIRDKSYPFLRRKYLRFIKEVFPQLSDYLPHFKEILDDVLMPNLNLRLWQDFTKYSIPNLLHYEDRNSMAFSIEARVPFLDYRFVDYIMAIPAIYKVHNGWSKWIFRFAMKDVLPERVLWRKDKIGFSTPEKRWLLEGDNPFKSFIQKYQIPYDGNYFWWRLFIAAHWMKIKERS